MDNNFIKKIPVDMRPVTEFHGGFDPGTLSTARMIQVAKKELGLKKGDKNIFICSEMYRCHIDGIQVEAGCTLGSGRLSVFDAGKTALIIYDAKKDKSRRFFRTKNAGSSSAVAKAVSGGRPRSEIKNIVESRAFALCKMKMKDVVAYEEVKISSPFKKFMLSGKVPEISKNYFKLTGPRTEASRGRELNKKDIENVREFAGSKAASFARSFGPYIKKTIEGMGEKFDIFAICESKSELTDVVQVITDQTFGNRHLLISGRNEDAVTFVNRKTNNGIRLSFGKKVMAENISIKTNIEETFPVDRIDPCSSCGDMVFDRKWKKSGKKMLCSNCHSSYWKSV